MSNERTNNSKSLSKVEQDWEGKNRSSDKQGTLLRSRQKPTQSNTIRYFSMFTGVGGFELGFKSANNSSDTRGTKAKGKLSSKGEGTIGQRNTQGIINKPKSNAIYRCIGMSEFNKYSSQVLRYRFPGIKNYGDCTKIKPEELPDFDMLCGGFPCQAFSIAGKRRGFEDIRGTMFFEVARILKVKRPKTILLENVKGLLNHDKGKTFRVILQTLDELGYEIQWMVLNSKFFGVPQNRERVLIIGNLRGTSRPEILPFRYDMSETPVKDKGQGILLSATTGARRVEQSNCLDTMYHKGLGSKQERPAVIKCFKKDKFQQGRIYETDGICPTLAGASKLSGDYTPRIRAVLTSDRINKRQNGRRFKEPGEPSFTVTGQDIHGVMLRDGRDNRSCLRSGRTPEVGYAGYSIRRLTPVECCRLQGFPDDWNEYGINEKGEKVKMSDTQRYKQMGNAVTTNVIAAVGSQILKSTDDKPKVVILDDNELSMTKYAEEYPENFKAISQNLNKEKRV
ncbi:MAG: DNA (cytosine-5-)-methyltransferase [Candidatus Heimdallarchaeaceae archaeon]